MRVFRKKTKSTSLVTFLLALALVLTSFPAIPVQAATEDWSKQEQQGTYTSTESTGYGDAYIRIGDIDNFGNGWSGGFDPFSGQVGTYTKIDNSQSYNGTDKLDSVNTVDFRYSLPNPYDVNYVISNARIEFYGTGFKAGNDYEVTMKFGDDEIRLTELEEILKLYDLKEGQAQFIPYRLPHRVLSYLESGAFSLTIKAFDSEGKPANFALDFVKLIINFQDLKNYAYIQGETYLAGTYNPNAPDGDQGTFVPWVTINAVGSNQVWYSEEDGHFDFKVTPGKVVLIVSKLGYKTQVITLDLAPGQTIEYDIIMEYGGGYADISIGAEDIDSLRNVRSIPKYLVGDNLGQARVDKIFSSPIKLTKDPDGKIDPYVEFDIKGMQLTEKKYQFIKVSNPSKVPPMPGPKDPNWKDLGEGTKTIIEPNTAEAYPDFMWAEKNHITVKHYEYNPKEIFGKEIDYKEDTNPKVYVTGKKNVLVANTNASGYHDGDDDQPAFFRNDANAGGKAMKAWGYLVLGPEVNKKQAIVLGIEANTGAYGYIEVGGKKIVFADGKNNGKNVISKEVSVELERGKIYPIYMEWYAENGTAGTFVPVYKTNNSEWRQIPQDWFYASSNEGPGQKGQQFETSALYKEVAFPKENGYYYVAVRANTAFAPEATHGLYGPFLIGDAEVEEEYTIELVPTQLFLNVDQVGTVTAKITPEGYQGEIKWTITNNKDAKKDVIEFTGNSTDLVKYVKGLQPGEATIRATLDNNATASCQVIVLENVKGSISLPNYLYIKEGTTKDLAAIVNLGDNESVKWEINGKVINNNKYNDEYIKVGSSKKNVLTIKGEKAAEDVYNIIARSADGKIESNVCKVYVYSNLNQHSYFVGESISLEELFPGLPTDRPDEVEFKVALGNDKVKINGGNVDAVKEGTAKVTATIKPSEDAENQEPEVIETNLRVFTVVFKNVTGQVFPNRATTTLVFEVTDGEAGYVNVGRDLKVKVNLNDLKDIATAYAINNIQNNGQAQDIVIDYDTKTFTISVASEGNKELVIFMDLTPNADMKVAEYNQLVKDDEKVPATISVTPVGGPTVTEVDEDLDIAYSTIIR